MILATKACCFVPRRACIFGIAFTIASAIGGAGNVAAGENEHSYVRGDQRLFLQWAEAKTAVFGEDDPAASTDDREPLLIGRPLLELVVMKDGGEGRGHTFAFRHVISY